MVDTSVTDKVLAIKGGSQAYNVNGGNTAGDWSLSHTHGAGTYTVNTYHRHNVGAYGAGSVAFLAHVEDSDAYTDYQGSTTTAISNSSLSGGPTAAWRPTAAVGALLKPDL